VTRKKVERELKTPEWTPEDEEAIITECLDELDPTLPLPLQERTFRGCVLHKLEQREQAVNIATEIRKESSKALSPENQQAYEAYRLDALSPELRALVVRLLTSSGGSSPQRVEKDVSAQRIRSSLKAFALQNWQPPASWRDSCDREAEKAPTVEQREAFREFCYRVASVSPDLIPFLEGRRPAYEGAARVIYESMAIPFEGTIGTSTEGQPEAIEVIMDRADAPKKAMATYKVGLRVPASLRSGMTGWMRRRQVLRFLYGWKQRKFRERQLKRVPKLAKPFPPTFDEAFAVFQEYASLNGAAEPLLQQYRRLFQQYYPLSTESLRAKYVDVKNKITALKRQDARFKKATFKAQEVPRIKDPAHPSPSEISLHDYQFLANQSIKLIAKYLNQFAEERIASIPLSRAALLAEAASRGEVPEAELRRRPYMAARAVLQTGRIMDQMMLGPMTAALQVYADLAEKLAFVKSAISTPPPSRADLSGLIPYFLTFYSYPRKYLSYFAKAWDVQLGWVRNTFVGWRRKLDPFLPAQFQIEPLTAVMQALAAHYQPYAKTEAERKVLGYFQKWHVLHLWQAPEIDLSKLLPKALRPAYEALRARAIPSPPAAVQASLASHQSKLTFAQFERAGQTLINEVQAFLATFPSPKRTSALYRRTQTFRRKLKFLLTQAPVIEPWLRSCLPGNRFARALARQLTTLKAAKARRYRNLFTAVRGCLALAFAEIYPKATAQFIKEFTPQHCLTLPYRSPKRRTTHQPLPLVFNKYLVERRLYPATGEFATEATMTRQFQAGNPIWLGIPIFAPEQLEETRPLPYRRGMFWFELVPSPKIIECVRRGASVRLIRLNVPTGPTQKIVADVILEAPTRAAFQHRGRFLAAWDRSYPGLNWPTGTYLGSDFNRLGAHTIHLATAAEGLPLSPLLHEFDRVARRLEWHRRWEIPRIQRKLAKGRGTMRQQGRRKTQITMLYQRRKRVLREWRNRRPLMVYLYGLYRTGAKYAAWDAVQGISPRGRAQRLTLSITTMPKRQELYTRFTQWAEDLRQQGLLPHYQETVCITPKSRKICAKCYAEGRGLRHTRKEGTTWDEFICTDPHCGFVGSSHTNSARLAALLLKDQLES